MMEIIDGKALAAQVLKDVAAQLATLRGRPVLVDMVSEGNDLHAYYARVKQKAAENCGIECRIVSIPQASGVEVYIRHLRDIQTNTPNLAGILVQLPLPSGISEPEVLTQIDPKYDVDCLSPISRSHFYADQQTFIPPTARAIMYLLDPYIAPGMKGVVMGQGELVGKPVTYLLRKRGLEVASVDIDTPTPGAIIQRADIVVTGIGKPWLLTRDWFKSGAIVIDAGTTAEEGSLKGDVNPQGLGDVLSVFSPVPGGVGPLTVAMLLDNVRIVATR
jgi:methylenetetrahydrofolate dehydrogenase (NADP+) / methenyltetrahydrofolate cyclohydrolase